MRKCTGTAMDIKTAKCSMLKPFCFLSILMIQHTGQHAVDISGPGRHGLKGDLSCFLFLCVHVKDLDR